jgi:hypothetical protein
MRTRNALRFLIDIGVDGDILFQCATDAGVTPDAIELVEKGLVAPSTVVARSNRGSPVARGPWLGLAARAALARGDKLGTARWLRAAYACAHPSFPPDLDMREIRGAADAELHAMLDRAGIPRGPSA